MQYEFPVQSGQQVEVRLYFYDGYSGTSSVGDRVFDVSIEGQTVLDDFDIIEKYGDDTGAMESFTVTSDGTIDIDFGHVDENPQINAIEIVSAESQPDELGGPGSVDFGQVLDGNSETKTVTVTNLGGDGDPSIDITGVSITGPDPGDFSAGAASQTTLAPGESADIPVTFTPSSVDPKSAALEVSHTGTNSPLTVDLSGEGVSAVDPNFDKSTLQGFSAGNPTALEWGPDGRLYVSTQGGTVYALQVERTGDNTYEVTNEVQIDAIKDIPNHDDFGNIESGETNRQITGLTVGGTASQPLVYVSSSDPEIDVGQDDDDTDTNSGAISRLTVTPGSDGTLEASEVTHEVIVFGLPRSEENHATNGLDLSPDGDTMYVAQGGHTNKGAPGDNFGHTPEYALSAAVLEIDLAQIENNYQAKNLNNYNSNYPNLDFYYGIPTIQNHDSTEGDDLPFGGDDGINQAKLIEGGPVQIYSPGYRNPYDLVLAESGQLYVSDHGPNGGWGGQPADASGNTVADAASVTNHPNEAGSFSTNDQLIAADEGEYGGHAAPIRANPTQADIYDASGNMIFDITESNSPVPSSMVNPVEADYIPPTGGSDDPNDPNYDPGADAGSANTMETTSGQKVLFGPTGGTEEYTASNFGGAMQGDILQVELGGDIERVELSADGQTATNVETIMNTGGPLGIAAQDDDEVFPGTVWTANHGGNDITVFEPVDYDGNVGDDCTGADDASLDEDGDGYDNADEIDAGTDPCSAASTPPDFDGDGTSNLNDPDDDNDGQPDTSDPFAVDPDDGTTTTLPVQHDLSELSLFGDNGQGWTGLMTNGQDDYQDLYDPTKMTVGGAAEVLTVEEVPPGDAYQTPNDQMYAFQFGVNPPDEPFVVETTVASFPENPENYQSAGLQIGTGDQSNYVKLVAAANGGDGGVEFATEVGDSFSGQMTDESGVTGNDVTLRMTIDPTTDPTPNDGSNDVAVTAEYEVDGTTTEVGTTSMPASWLDTSDGSGLAVGIISTSNGASSTFSATWTDISVTLADSPPTIQSISDQTVTEGDSATVPVSASDPDGESVSLSLSQSPDFVTLSNSEISIDPQDGDAGTYTVEVTAEANGKTTTESSQLIVEEPVATGTVVYTVNAGGSEYTAGDGTTYAADPTSALVGISTVYSTSQWASTPPEIQNTDDDPLYRTERYGTDFGYEIPVPESGTYQVTLKFAEIYQGTQADSDPSADQTGQRVFDVTTEGSTTLNDYDVYAEAGGSLTAVDETYTVEVTDGTLNIGFDATGDDAADNAKISAIKVVKVDTGDLTVAEAVAAYDDGDDTINLNEIQTAINWWSTNSEVPGTGGETISLQQMQELINIWSTGATVGGGNTAPSIDAIADQTVTEGETAQVSVSASDPDGDSLTLSKTSGPSFVTLTDNGDGTGTLDIAPQSGDAGTYTVEVTADDGTATATESFQLTVEEATTGTGNVLFRVNAGGGQLSATDSGPDWEAGDGTYVVAGGEMTDSWGPATSIDSSVPSSTPPELFETERWDETGGMQYEFPVPDGTEVEVRLYFRSGWDGASDPGDRVFDVAIEGQTVLDDYDIVADVGHDTGVMKSFTVTSDGTVDIDFAHVTQNPLINGIEIVETSDGGSTGATSADVAVNSGSSNIDASTFNSGSFEVTNTGDEPITSVEIDLSESAIPDAVFDPQGTAGDAGSKGLVIDSESGDGVGVVSTDDADVFSQPQNGQNADDGYKALTIEFSDFEAGETVAFSVDIDPTTIKNADTTGGEGSVSGLELSGSAVTVSSSSTTVSNDLFTDGSQGGSQSSVSSDAPAAPTLGIQGVTLQSTDFPNHQAATVSSTSQTLTLSGPAGATVELLTIEASAPPSDGYDVDAFEADNAETVSQQTVTLDSNGQATVPVSLSSTNLNYFQAAVQDGSGATGMVSGTVVLEVQTNTAPSIDAISDQTVVTGETVTVPVSASDADGDSLTLSKTSGPAFVTLTDNGDGTGSLAIAPGSADAGTYTVEVTAADGTTTTTESFQLTVETATSTTSGTVLHRVNAGESTTISATDGGPDWTGVDSASTNGPLVSLTDGNTGSGATCIGDEVTPGSEVPSSTPDAVYDCEQYGTMTWEFDVTSGSEVEVRLYVGNSYTGADTDGDRQYNVGIEGDQVLTEYDPVQDVGDDTGTVKAFTVTEDGDGTVQITFTPGAVENPEVRAIEIVETGSSS